jgi:hypothetical protein
LKTDRAASRPSRADILEQATSATKTLTIDSCIFSADDNDDCLIYTALGPVTVTNSYFTRSKAANFKTQKENCVFTVTNCYFDRMSLANASYSGTNANAFAFNGRTPYIAYKDTFYCPAAPSPVATPSLTTFMSRTATGHFTRRGYAWLPSRSNRILRSAWGFFLFDS